MTGVYDPLKRLRELCDEVRFRRGRASQEIHQQIRETLDFSEAARIAPPEKPFLIPSKAFVRRASLFSLAVALVVVLDNWHLAVAPAYLTVTADELSFRAKSPFVAPGRPVRQPFGANPALVARELSVLEYRELQMPPTIPVTLPREAPQLRFSSTSDASVTIEALQVSDETDVTLVYDRRGRIEVHLSDVRRGAGRVSTARADVKLTLSERMDVASDGARFSAGESLPASLELFGGSGLVAWLAAPTAFTAYPVGVSRLQLGRTELLDDVPGAHYYREVSTIRDGMLSFPGFSITPHALRPMEPLLLEASERPGSAQSTLVVTVDPQRGLTAIFWGEVAKARRGPERGAEDLMPTWLDRFTRSTRLTLLWGAAVGLVALAVSVFSHWKGR